MTLDEIIKIIPEWKDQCCCYIARPYMEKCFGLNTVRNIRANQHILLYQLPKGAEDIKADNWEIVKRGEVLL